MADDPRKTAADAAAAWYARNEGPMMSADERAALDAWIKGDAEAQGAWANVGKLDAMLDQVADDPAIVALREAARTPADSSHARRWVIGGTLAAALVAAVGLPMASQWTAEMPSVRGGTPRHYAATTQARSVTLADGSTMLLDARSSATVSLGDVRAVALKQGRALFSVAQDKAHPFVVTANGNTITALGTQFTAERAGDDTIVALLEGSVRVVTRAGARTLRPGDTLRANARTLSLGRDAETAAGWRDGRLDFTSVPLGDVAAALSRYGPTRIVIADADLSRQPYSGSLKTEGGSDALVAALIATRAARVASRTPGTVTLTR